MKNMHKTLLPGLFALVFLLPACTPAGCKKIAFVFSDGANPDIYTACPDGNQLTPLTSDPAADLDPAWAPGGERIAFSSNRSGTSQVYVMDASGGGLHQITTDYENDDPIWLADGEHVAVRSTDGKGLWWWRIVDLGSGEASRFNEPSYDFFFPRPAWSPDGKEIAVMSLVEQQERNDGASQIHVKAVDGSADRALTNDTWANINPVWSADGTKIAFLSERDGTYNVYALYVISKDGRNLRRLSEPVFSESAIPTWSPDGRQIAIAGDTGGITIINLNGGNSRVFLQSTEGKSASMPAWQP